MAFLLFMLGECASLVAFCIVPLYTIYVFLCLLGSCWDLFSVIRNQLLTNLLGLLLYYIYLVKGKSLHTPFDFAILANLANLSKMCAFLETSCFNRQK